MKLKTFLEIEENSRKLEKLHRWMRGKKSYPFKMIIFPTYRCNLNCHYCPFSLSRSEFDKFQELSQEEWMEILDKSLEYIEEWRFFGGGEPMMRRDLVLLLIKKIKNYDSKADCEIITNGTLLNRAAIEQLVKEELNRIIISIDAPEARVHDRLRNTPGSFNKAIKTIKTFKQFKKRFKTDRPKIKINMILNKFNFGKIEKATKFFASLGCDELALHPMRIYHEKKAVLDLVISDREKRKLYDQIEKSKKTATKLGIKLNIDMLKETEIRKREKAEKKREGVKTQNSFLSSICFEPFYTLFVDPQGRSAPCNGLGIGFEDQKLLDKELEEVWFSQKFDEIRERVINRKPMDSCLKCGLSDMTEKLRRNLRLFSRVR